MFDIKKVQEEVEKEVQEEQMKEAKRRMKVKLKQVADAKTVLANLEREYEDLLHAISEGN